MKITKQLLKQIIKEELKKVLAEQSTTCGPKLNSMVGKIYRGCRLLRKSFNIGGLNNSGMVPLTAKPAQAESALNPEYFKLFQKELDNLNLKDGECGKPTLHVEGGKLIAIKLQK